MTEDKKYSSVEIKEQEQRTRTQTQNRASLCTFSLNIKKHVIMNFEIPAHCWTTPVTKKGVITRFFNKLMIQNIWANQYKYASFHTKTNLGHLSSQAPDLKTYLQKTQHSG